MASGERDAFVDGDASYDIASMVIIRLATVTERSGFEPWAQVLSRDELAAIRAIGEIAAHAGNAVVNGDLLWGAVTVRVPEIIERLLGR